MIQKNLLKITALAGLVFFAISTLAAQEKFRVFMTTDAGGDSDDQGSFVRFLLYSAEWDVEGIVAEREETDNWPLGNGTGLELLRVYLDAYGDVLSNLQKHDSRYPSKDYLWDRTVSGYSDKDGDGLTDGTELLIKAIEKDDPRPLWIVEYGTYGVPGTVSQIEALIYLRNTKSPEEYKRLKNKMYFSTLDERDIQKILGPEGRGWRAGLDPMLPEGMDKGEEPGPSEDFGIYVGTGRPPWSRNANDWDLNDDLKEDHGPLGSIYTKTKEGDTNGFTNLFPTGMNHPLHPTWGSWAGRFERVYENKLPNYYWNEYNPESGEESWGESGKRWEDEIANDFAVRADWCVASSHAEGNHHPKAVVDGDESKNILFKSMDNKSQITLDASKSSDPDGNDLTFEWFFYPEASHLQNGSWGGSVIKDAATSKPTIRIPDDAREGDSIHVLLKVTDNDSHRAELVEKKDWLRRLVPLTSYRRVVLLAGNVTVTLAPSITAKRPFQIQSRGNRQWSINTMPGSAHRLDIIGLNGSLLETFSGRGGETHLFESPNHQPNFLIRQRD